MSDAQENGQVETPTTAQTAPATAVNGSATVGEIKVAGPLSEDNRTAIEAKGWGKEGVFDLNKVIDGYRNLESHASKALVMPSDGATADDWNAFYGKLGRPETADKYQLKLDAAAVPEGFPYDEKSAIEFRNWAHADGLSGKQAQGLHDKFIGWQAAQFKEAQAANVARESEAHREIVTKWGDPESTGYKQNVELASRAVLNLGLMDGLKEGGLLSSDGTFRNPALAQAMAKVGRELFAEDSMATGANGMISNPFSNDAGQEDITAQGRLVRSDPKKARSLMVAAGRNPAEYGL